MDIAEKAWHRADQLSEVGLMGASAIRGMTGAAANPDTPGGTQSIQRAVAVLRILATARETGLGLTEISVQAALPHPTAHRILRILIAEGIVEQKPGTRRYVIGEQIPLLALSRRTRDPLLEVVVPHLKSAVSEIGDAGFFTRRAGFDTVCVARHLGAYPVQVLAWDVGERRPLGVSNAGIAILSGMQTDALRGVLAENRSRLSGYGVSKDAILQEVALARERGYAARTRSLTPGASAVSVLIRSSNGAALGAITINAVSYRLSPRRTLDVATRLRIGAEAVESELRKRPRNPLSKLSLVRAG
jgi:DNA-binding IclR family transcriptional regulator